MKLKKILKITGLVVIVIIVVAVASMSVIILDLMSYTATSSQTLTPSGTPVGHALVVYDPGVTGAAKSASEKIAGDLQANGYVVDLAGIRSGVANNTSMYDVIAIGGPIYGGNTSKSITSYLKMLAPPENAKIGVFAIGTSQFYDQDEASLNNETAWIQGDNPLCNIVIDRVIRGDEANNDSMGFVTDLLK
jgi:flavodoxin